MTNNNNHNITFGAQSLTIEDVVAIAQGAKANMNTSPEFTAKIDRGVAFLERLLKEEGVIYGYPVTCSGGKFQIVQGLEINEFSRGKMDATDAELREERAAVEDLFA